MKKPIKNPLTFHDVAFNLSGKELGKDQQRNLKGGDGDNIIVVEVIEG